MVLEYRWNCRGKSYWISRMFHYSSYSILSELGNPTSQRSNNLNPRTPKHPEHPWFQICQLDHMWNEWECASMPLVDPHDTHREEFSNVTHQNITTWGLVWYVVIWWLWTFWMIWGVYVLVHTEAKTGNIFPEPFPDWMGPAPILNGNPFRKTVFRSRTVWTRTMKCPKPMELIYLDL